MDKKRVLMTYIESGMGHITSITSISDNLKKFYGDQFEIIDSYIMDEDDDKSLKSWFWRLHLFLFEHDGWGKVHACHPQVGLCQIHPPLHGGL